MIFFHFLSHCIVNLIEILFTFFPFSIHILSSLCRIMNSIDNVLHLSEIFGLKACEPGVLVVEYIFSIVWQLLDAAVDDEGLLELTPERESKWISVPRDMELDGDDSYDEKRIKYQEGLYGINTVMAIELIGQFLQNKVTSRILYLARRNMSELYSFFHLLFELRLLFLFFT